MRVRIAREPTRGFRLEVARLGRVDATREEECLEVVQPVNAEDRGLD
jgi:hypothetical protein